MFLRVRKVQQDSKGVLALLGKKGTKDHRGLQDYKDR
jgi:hypothetical protein